MNLQQCRALAKVLYFSTANKTNVDDFQWNLMLNSFNKHYFQEAAKFAGSIFGKDTPDLQSSPNGQVDFSGSLFGQNDVPYYATTDFTAANGFWTLLNSATVHNATIAPDGSQTADLLLDTVANGIHAAQVNPMAQVLPVGQWAVTIYAKASTLNWLWIGGSSGGTIAWFNVRDGVLGTVNAGLQATIVPAPQPGFTNTPGVTSSPAPVVSSTGWYKCTVTGTSTGSTSDRIQFGLANADGVFSYAGTGQGVYLWGARRWFTDNMIDPLGVYQPLAVEIKFLGRYIHLDYEHVSDRYIYNIAFGQVQVLVPSAWTLHGEKILLLPLVNGAQTVRITYVPHIGEWNQDADQALHGLFPEYHELIAYEAAVTLAGGAGAQLMMMRDRLRKNWTAYLNSRSRQDGRHIRFVPYE